MLREHQKGDTDCQSFAQLVNATATPTRAELQASSLSLRVLAKDLERISVCDVILVLGEEIDGTKRVILPTYLIRTVIEEAQ